jgi:2-hydroxychromene-2-carboxylate isomerase
MTVAATPAQPVFYYDLGSPDCYLAAERILASLPVMPEWEPVLGAQIGATWDQPDREQIAAAASQAELQPLRWPAAWPPQTERAMLAATFAKRVGRAVAFSLAAFRQAFAGGRDLGDESTILLAAAACEMHPTALLKGMGLRSVNTALQDAGQRARAAGASSLPAIQVGDELFAGPHSVEQAGAALAVIR